MKRARSISAVAALAASGGLLLAGSAPGADGTPVPSATAPIVVGIDGGGGPWLSAYDSRGGWKTGFLPYFDLTAGGLDVAAGDLDGNGTAEIVTVPGLGGRGEVRTFDATGTRTGPTALATSSGCGSRVAVGDVSGDGRDEIVTGFESCSPSVQVFDGTSGKRLAFFGPFNAGGGDHGIRVAVGDVTGDDRAEVITGAGPGDAPTVRVFAGTPSTSFPTPLRTFDAFPGSVTGGLEVATGDTNGDGRSEIVVGAETADDAQIKIFDAAGTELRSFRPFGLVATGTLRLAVSDLDRDGGAEIVAGAHIGYSTLVRIFSSDGVQLGELAAPLYSGRSLAVGDVDGDPAVEIVMGTGPGYSSWVVTFEPSGVVNGTNAYFQAYGNSFTNGVRVAAGDVDGNGTVEYISAQGGGGGSELLVLDAHGEVLRELYPFGETWRGLYVAAGDLDGDLDADVVAAAGWGEPQIKTYDGDGTERSSFLAFDADLQAGVRVASGDLDGDGRAEILAAPGPGGPPVVRVFDRSGRRVESFFALDSSDNGGLYVAAGDVDDDGRAEIVVGAGTSGDVRVFDANGTLRSTFNAYPEGAGYSDGVRVAVGDVDGDGDGEIVTGPGRIRPVDVRVFSGDGTPVGGFRAHPEFQGGIFVAVPAALGPRLEVTAVNVQGVEGHPLGFAASLVDPRGGSTPERFAATIAWGDNHSTEGVVSSLGGGRYQVDAVHSYSTYGRHRITARFADVYLRGAIVTATATVADAPLLARGRSIRTSRREFAGVVATVRDRDPLGSPSDLLVRVVWGDGKSSEARAEGANGRFRVRAHHRYRIPGSYRVVVRIRSLGGSAARATSHIEIAR